MRGIFLEPAPCSGFGGASPNASDSGLGFQGLAFRTFRALGLGLRLGI